MTKDRVSALWGGRLSLAALHRPFVRNMHQHWWTASSTRADRSGVPERS